MNHRNSFFSFLLIALPLALAGKPKPTPVETPLFLSDSTQIATPQKIVQSSSKLNLDSIAQAADYLLKGVTVVAQKPLFKKEADKLIYDVESDPDSKTKNMIEMLRKVPLVTVDAEENIEVNGSSKFKVYVNGKPNNMMSNNPKDVLRSMPASSIKKIEVITNPGAKYDAEGVKGILNIITVSRLQGYNLSLNASARNSGIYSGIYATVQKGKFTTTVRYNHNIQRQPQGSSESERITSDSEDHYKLYNKGISHRRGHSDSGSIEASYEIDTLRLITLSGDFYASSSKPRSLYQTQMLSQSGNLTYGYQYQSNSENSYGWGGGSIDYQRSFHKPDRLLTFSYRLSTEPEKNKNYITYTETVGNAEDLSSLNNQYSDDKTKSTEQTFQTDYTDPLTKHHQIETGLKYILRRNQSDNYYYTSPLENATYTLNESKSSVYSHHQNILAAYLSYTYKWSFLTAKAGLRYERTDQKVKYKVGEGTNFTANFDNLVPSSSITFKLGEKDNLEFSYNMGIYRPGIYELNPYIDRSTPNQLSYGNSTLESVKNHNFSIEFSHFTQKLYLSLSTYYSFSNNDIENYQFVRNDTLHSTYGNIGLSRRGGISSYISWTPTQGTRVYINQRVSYSHEASPSMNLSGHGFNYYAYAGLQQTLFAGIRGSLSGGGSTKYYGLQGTSTGYLFYSASISRDFLKSKKLSAYLFANNFLQPHRIYKSNTAGSNFTSHSSGSYYQASYGVSVSYRIGKLQSSVKKARRSIQNDESKGSGNKGGGGGE